MPYETNPDGTQMWVPEDDRVDSEVARITAGNTPLMRQARAGARARAHRRGLMSTSLAAGAGEQAVISTALPMAQQNAQQTARKNLSRQQYGQDLGIVREQGTQQRLSTDNEFKRRGELSAQDYDQQGRLIDRDYDRRGQLSAQEFDQQGRLIDRDYGHRRDLSAQDYRQQGSLMDRDFAGRAGLLNTEYDRRGQLSAQEARQQSDLQRQRNRFEADQRSRDRHIQAKTARLDRASRERVNALNVTTQERERAATLATQANATYNQALANIAANPDLPSAARRRMQQEALDVYRNNMTMLEKLYNRRLNWAA